MQSKVITAETARRYLVAALNAAGPREEAAAWELVIGSQPVWSLAASYCAQRRHACRAIEAGFDKSGAAVIALIEALKARAPGPREPEVYTVPETLVCVWVWRTSEGAKPVMLERCPKVEPQPEDGPSPEQFWHWPDQWRQVRAVPVDDLGGIYHVDTGDRVVTWTIPSRSFSESTVVTPFDRKVSTPCSKCGAASVLECGHKTFEEELGAELPEFPKRLRCEPCSAKANAATDVFHEQGACDPPTGPCVICKTPLCVEEDGYVCRLPGCKANPDKSIPDPEEEDSLFDMTGTLARVQTGKQEDASTDSIENEVGSEHALQQEDSAPRIVERVDAGKCDHYTVEGAEDVCPCPKECNCHPCAGGDLQGGIEPTALCESCAHAGLSHDHESKICAQCDRCTGFVVAASLCTGCDRPLMAGEYLRCSDCVRAMRAADDRCECGCARTTHSRPDDSCSKCPCVAFRLSAGEPEQLVTKEMDRKDEQSRQHRFVDSLDMSNVRKQRKTKKGYACCEICFQRVGEGDEWVSRLNRSVRKRAHLACADEVALEIAALKTA